MEETGCIVLADISGYTEFVTKTELEHGGAILQSLLEIVVGETKKPLSVLEIEGDAVFSYAPTAQLKRGELLAEMVENMYSAFRHALEDSRRSTTCNCGACANMSELDMKFVVHHGSTTQRRVGAHQGIAGPTVVLAHRLLKNTVAEKIGCGAYVLFTSQAVAALHLTERAQGMTPHEEAYEHLGSVQCHVEDLSKRWTELSAEKGFRVQPEDSWLTLSENVPVARGVAWEYFSNPELQRQWTAADSFTSKHPRPGRPGPGTVSHCVHGRDVKVLKTLAWSPLHFATIALQLPLGALGPQTVLFEDDGDGTRVTFICGQVMHDSALVRALLTLGFRLFGKAGTKRILTQEATTYFEMLREHAARDETKPEALDTSV